ncbi:MAG: DNA polymerase IV [Acidobacteriota bacterium]
MRRSNRQVGALWNEGPVQPPGESLGERRILHCDMDCFFAAVHMRDDPELQGKPVVIGGDPEGRGVVAAASYEARSFGVRSAMPASRAKRLCPDAIFLRSDFSRYRKESEQIFRMFRDVTDLVQPVSVDEAYLDVTEAVTKSRSATSIAQELRARVQAERNLTLSVGVGPNRLVAKIASDFDKPDGLTVVPPRKVERFLRNLPARALPGVGPATARRLQERLGVETVQQLRQVGELPLVEIFGRYGAVLFRYAWGRDDRAVRVERERKSLSAERTYPQDLKAAEEIAAEITRLSQTVSEGLQGKDLEGFGVTLKVRYENFETVTRSKTLARSTSRAAELERHAIELLGKTEAGRRPVRLLGLGMAKLVAAEADQGPQQLEIGDLSRDP